jgi:hypothetical protein
MDKHTFMIQANLIFSTVFLTYRVIAFTKYYLLSIYPFTYFSANRYKTKLVRELKDLIKTMIYKIGGSISY